ncbi:MAG: VCBS repeat-containing protein [Syntrophales bacterium]
MKIAASTIGMVANRFQEETHTVVEELHVWTDAPASSSPRDTVRLSEQAKSILAVKEEKSAVLDPDEAIQHDPKLLIIKKLIEALTGNKITLGTGISGDSTHEGSSDGAANEGSPTPTDRVGWGMRYEYHETYAEKEETAFAAGGIIRTADGKEIAFTLNLTMRREFFESTDISIRAGDAPLVDPLVINFTGNAAELTDQKFTFDLDADGSEELIPFVAQGSGFLVFDRNGDQKVNNGSELFGPATGDGFQELAAFDQTKDGWIDENDGIYQQLSIWTKDEAGGDHLQGLKESGVGALSVSAVATSFDLKNQENELGGRINRTGIYLSDDGYAGTVQQIDVAV